MINTVLEAKGIAKTHKAPSGEALNILNNISLVLKQGEIKALVGQSGSGKSTLLQILGCLEKPSTGEIIVQGIETMHLSDRARAQCRMQHIGFVYQASHLLPEFTAAENISIPQRLLGKSKKESKKRALELLSSVGLTHRADHRPSQLSGGEQQRVAIARALANKPSLILADEPTGNLDSKNAQNIYTILVKMAKEEGCSVILATHDKDISSIVDSLWHIKDGCLETA